MKRHVVKRIKSRRCSLKRKLKRHFNCIKNIMIDAVMIKQTPMLDALFIKPNGVSNSATQEKI